MSDASKTAAPSRRALITGGAALAAGAGTALARPAGAQALPAGAQYVPAADPYRTYDSRDDDDGKIEFGQTYIVDMSGIPEESIAVMVNVTVTDTEEGGWLAVYGQGRERPDVSTINWFASDQMLANMVSVPTGETDNDLAVYGGGQATHFVIDVYGWYIPPAA